MPFGYHNMKFNFLRKYFLQHESSWPASYTLPLNRIQATFLRKFRHDRKWRIQMLTTWWSQSENADLSISLKLVWILKSKSEYHYESQSEWIMFINYNICFFYYSVQWLSTRLQKNELRCHVTLSLDSNAICVFVQIIVCSPRLKFLPISAEE